MVVQYLGLGIYGGAKGIKALRNRLYDRPKRKEKRHEWFNERDIAGMRDRVWQDILALETDGDPLTQPTAAQRDLFQVYDAATRAEEADKGAGKRVYKQLYGEWLQGHGAFADKYDQARGTHLNQIGQIRETAAARDFSATHKANQDIRVAKAKGEDADTREREQIRAHILGLQDVGLRDRELQLEENKFAQEKLDAAREAQELEQARRMAAMGLLPPEKELDLLYDTKKKRMEMEMTEQFGIRAQEMDQLRKDDAQAILMEDKWKEVSTLLQALETGDFQPGLVVGRFKLFMRRPHERAFMRLVTLDARQLLREIWGETRPTDWDGKKAEDAIADIADPVERVQRALYLIARATARSMRRHDLLSAKYPEITRIQVPLSDAEKERRLEALRPFLMSLGPEELAADTALWSKVRLPQISGEARRAFAAAAAEAQRQGFKPDVDDDEPEIPTPDI